MTWNFELMQKEVNEIISTKLKDKEKLEKLTEFFFDKVARSAPVDEKFYISAYPDIAIAIEGGQIESAAQHYVEHGFYEGRLPMKPRIDEERYIVEYPDVGEAIRNGLIPNASDHWERFGRHEGRRAYLIFG